MNNMPMDELYEEYIPLLRSIASSYHKSTGLDVQDLYSEAVMGLMKAEQGFDPDRGDNFKYFALRKIKDQLHDFIRKFSSSVVIPSYIKKASSLFDRLNVCLLSYGVSDEHINSILYYGLDSDVFNEYNCCENLLNKLNSAAERAGISYKELVQRSCTLPIDIEVNDDCAIHTIEDPLSIVDIRQFLTDEELIVVEGISAGKTYKEIGEENNHSHTWAHNIIKKVRIKLQSWA